MIRCFRRVMVLSAALAFAGCGTIPLASLPALSRIDIATTDPAVLRVAVRLPGAVKPRPGGVTMDAVMRESGAAERTATSYLMTSETGRYVVLTEDADLRSRPKVEGELEGLEPC
jgi:hypothetical protein